MQIVDLTREQLLTREIDAQRDEIVALRRELNNVRLELAMAILHDRRGRRTAEVLGLVGRGSLQ